MTRARLRIAHLMGLVGLAAIGLLAWREGRRVVGLATRLLVDGWLPNITMGLACVLALVAVIAAFVRKGRARWFAAGYASTFLLLFYTIDQMPGLKRFLDDPVATRSWDIASRCIAWASPGSFYTYHPHRIFVYLVVIMAFSLAGGLVARSLSRRPARPSPTGPLTTAQP